MRELSEQDQAAIQRLFETYGELWASGDAAGCAALYTDDGDGLGIDGQMLVGPKEVQSYYEEHLTGKYKDLTMSDLQLESPRALSEDVALMDGSWMIHGFRSESGEPTPVRVRGTFIVRKQADDWRFAAVRLMVPFHGNV